MLKSYLVFLFLPESVLVIQLCVCLCVCVCVCVCVRFIYLFLVFLTPNPRHMEVSRLGSNWSCSRRPMPQPQQSQIRAESASYTTDQGNGRSLTHWARPGIEPESSWALFGSVTTEPQWEFFFFFFFVFSRVAPAAYGGSWARDLIGVVATSLHRSHSNARSKLRLPPIPQLTAMPDP